MEVQPQAAACNCPDRQVGECNKQQTERAEGPALLWQQRSHHRKRDFKVELLDLLQRHEIDYDPEDIWK